MSVTTKKKHVEREVYEDFSALQQHQSIVRVVRPRGNNLHQVATAEGEEYLVSMPLKFRKHMWIKRGDYVVTEPIPEGNKVRAEIVRILLKEHIRTLTQNKQWPAAFLQLEAPEDPQEGLEERLQDCSGSDSEGEQLVANPNRVLIDTNSTDSDTDSSEGDTDDCADKSEGDTDESDQQEQVEAQASHEEKD